MDAPDQTNPTPRCAADACGQGRKPCPFPSACQVADEHDPAPPKQQSLLALAAWLGITAAAVAAVAVVIAGLPWRFA
jgi:hypothetical protein